jgi:hypothetical protein
MKGGLACQGAFITPPVNAFATFIWKNKFPSEAARAELDHCLQMYSMTNLIFVYTVIINSNFIFSCEYKHRFFTVTVYFAVRYKSIKAFGKLLGLDGPTHADDRQQDVALPPAFST